MPLETGRGSEVVGLVLRRTAVVEGGGPGGFFAEEVNTTYHICYENITFVRTIPRIAVTFRLWVSVVWKGSLHHPQCQKERQQAKSIMLYVSST